MTNLTQRRDPDSESASSPHRGLRAVVWATGLVLTAFGVSVAADQAILGAATPAQHTKLVLGGAIACLGLTLASTGWPRRREAATAARSASLRWAGRILIFGSMALLLSRGVVQVIDLSEHLDADLDEPTTTLVHIIRLALTTSLAAATALIARRQRRHRCI